MAVVPDNPRKLGLGPRPFSAKSVRGRKNKQNMADEFSKMCSVLAVWLFLVSFDGFFCSHYTYYTLNIIFVSSVIAVCAPTQKNVFLHQKMDILTLLVFLFVLVVLVAVFQHFCKAYSQKTKETITGMFFMVLLVTFMLLSIF